MSFARSNQLSVFAALRPKPNQTASKAVVTTYSLDLVAMLGLVLALGDQGEAELAASPLGLVDAFENVRGKLLVMHQLGRIEVPTKHRSVLPLLETMLHPVPADERRSSWHPKVAIARYESDEGIEWRFWIGSRNLTGSTDLDAGLLLVADATKDGRAIPDIAELAGDLLKEANWSEGELAELGGAKWREPNDVKVRRLIWRRNGESRSFLEELSPGKPEQLYGTSPFVDRTGLKEIMRTKPAPFTLLTTMQAGSDISPFDDVEFRIAGAPEPVAPVGLDISETTPENDFSELPNRGIHAKLLMGTTSSTAFLSLGSANLTRRGLLGPNAEANAILDIECPELVDSLVTFVQTSMELPADAAADAELLAQEQARRELDRLISELLKRNMRLEQGPEGLLLKITPNIDRLLSEVRVFAASFCFPENWVEWKVGTTSVRLSALPRLADQTTLVTFRVFSRHDPEIRRMWTQRVDWSEFDSERRDHALLVNYIGPSRFRAWLRLLMEGFDATSDECWTDATDRYEPHKYEGLHLDGHFFLETMLSNWARDPRKFEGKVPSMANMLASFREAFQELEDEEERNAAIAELDEVEPILNAMISAVPKAAT